MRYVYEHGSDKRVLRAFYQFLSNQNFKNVYIFKIFHVLTIESNCFQHVKQSKAQTVLIKLSDKFNVCCHGNSCTYGLHTSLKTGFLISNAFVNTGCAFVGYL